MDSRRGRLVTTRSSYSTARSSRSNRESSDSSSARVHVSWRIAIFALGRECIGLAGRYARHLQFR